MQLQLFLGRYRLMTSTAILKATIYNTHIMFLETSRKTLDNRISKQLKEAYLQNHSTQPSFELSFLLCVFIDSSIFLCSCQGLKDRVNSNRVKSIGPVKLVLFVLSICVPIWSKVPFMCGEGRQIISWY